MDRLLIVSFAEGEATQLAGFAHALGLPFDILSLCGEPETNVGAETVFCSRLDSIPPADGLAHPIAERSVGYTHVAAVSSMRSKDVMARAAGVMDAAMVTDVIGCESPTLFHRPMVAGSIVATVEVLATPVVLTVRPAGFPKAEPGGASEVTPWIAEVVSKAVVTDASSRTSARPDLTQAKVVVSGGRPLKDAETFERLIGGLADKFGGAVGATRAAVDSGIAPNESQVGQTGKIVAPDLYIAAGISGSTQHLAGIKDSKVIVAINKDADAPIFGVADFGIVGDLYEVIPTIMAAV